MSQEQAMAEEIEDLKSENARLTADLGEIGMSDFGGNNEADSKLRQHCIALEAENARLTECERKLKEWETPMTCGHPRALVAVEDDYHCYACQTIEPVKQERDALATRCGELEAALKTWRMLFTQAELLERVELDTKLTASFSTPK